MAAETDVIREFLVSLGFKVDQNGLKKFVGALGATSKESDIVSKSVLGIGLAAQAMVAQYSSSMEKLYFASRRTHASVENIQALEFGTSKIGIAAGVAREALENMSAAVRTNPGIRGLMDGLLGKDTAGLDQAQVMIELVQKLSQMPHYEGAQFAQLFGIDEKTFKMMVDSMPELLAAEKERIAMNKQAGIDAQAAAAAGHEYANSLRDISAAAGVLRDRIAIELLPQFRDFNKEVRKLLDEANKFKLGEHPEIKKPLEVVLDNGKKIGSGVKDTLAGVYNVDASQTLSGVKNLGSGLWGLAKSGIFDKLNPGAVVGKGVTAWTKRAFVKFDAWGKEVGARGSENNAQRMARLDREYAASLLPQNKSLLPPDGTPEATKLFAGLESKYALPPGILDKIWNKESHRGDPDFMLSKKGAKGHFGLMDGTAKDLGVTDPNDLVQSATAAARYFAQLMKRYKNDPTMASAAYNWGMGNLDKKGLDAAPFETRDYVDTMTGSHLASSKTVTIHNKTDIHVNGAQDPAATGRAVAMVQDEVTGQMVRNMGGAIR